MTTVIEKLDRALYPHYARNWDDELFRQRILWYLRGYTIALDLAAGAGIVPQMNLRCHPRRLCGIDPDPRVVNNPYLDEGRVGVGESIPYPDASFDLVFADNVLEHLPDPARVFAEVARVLRRGASFSGRRRTSGTMCR